MKKFLSLVVVLLVSAWPARAEDVAALVAKLKSADSDERRQAAKALAERGADAKEAAPALLAALKNDKDLFVRRFAAQGLGEVGADPKEAVPALRAALRENRKELSEAAIGALGKMGPTAAPALADVLKVREAPRTKGKPPTKGGPPPTDQSAFLRGKAAEALGRLGADGKAGVPALIEALKDPAIRTEAALALGNIGPAAKDALSPLEEAASARGANRDRAFRQAVAQAIKKIKS